MVNERHDVVFLVGAVLGSMAGAAYGLYNAPQAGWRTRADLAGAVEEIGDRVAHRVAIVVTEFRQVIGDDVPEPISTDARYFPRSGASVRHRADVDGPLPIEGVTTL